MSFIMAMFVFSSCDLFVYKLDTSIGTKIIYWPIFVSFFYETDKISCALKKVVVSVR